MPKLSHKTIFIISGIGFFLVISTLFAFYFNSQNSNSQTKSQNSSQNNSQNSSINTSLSISNSQNSSFQNSNSNVNSSQISTSNSQISSNSQDNSTILSPTLQNNQNSTQNNQNPVENSQTTSNSNLQTYTNPSYPNLKINYDNSWKIERKSIPRENGADLSDGEIILTKNGAKMTINLYSSGQVYTTGFGPTTLETVNLGKFSRYKVQNRSNSPIFYEYNPLNYKDSTDTDQKIKTNIKYDANKHFGGMSNGGKNSLLDLCKEDPVGCDVKDDLLLFTMKIKLETQNSDLIKEADQIIKNSVLE